MLYAILFLQAALATPPGDEAPWSQIQSKPVRVECATVGGEPWCRSLGMVHAPIAQVTEALKSMRYNASIFQSIVKIDIIDPETIRVVLDYPSPLSDRDYVAHYTHAAEGDVQVFRWTPVASAAAPESSEAVRLPHFAGEWRLEPRSEGTWVRYTWQAEINGDFPSFGYSQAWKRAGYEALRDLANTQQATLTAE